MKKRSLPELPAKKIWHEKFKSELIRNRSQQRQRSDFFRFVLPRASHTAETYSQHATNDINMLFTAPDSTTSHGEEHPYDRFFRFWVFGVMLPATAVAWHCTGGRILLSLAAALVLPLLAIAQGATGILKYRLYYADAPVPLSPSHGVVIVPKSSSPRKRTAAAAALRISHSREHE